MLGEYDACFYDKTRYSTVLHILLIIRRKLINRLRRKSILSKDNYISHFIISYMTLWKETGAAYLDNTLKRLIK